MAGLGAGTPADRPLYQVLEQRAAGVGAGALMGSDHTYVLPAGEANRPRRYAHHARPEAPVAA